VAPEGPNLFVAEIQVFGGGLRPAGKQVLLVNRDQPLPTLAFLI
jgi:hypothetical protein